MDEGVIGGDWRELWGGLEASLLRHLERFVSFCDREDDSFDSRLTTPSSKGWCCPGLQFASRRSCYRSVSSADCCTLTTDKHTKTGGSSPCRRRPPPPLAPSASVVAVLQYCCAVCSNPLLAWSSPPYARVHAHVHGHDHGYNYDDYDVAAVASRVVRGPAIASDLVIVTGCGRPLAAARKSTSGSNAAILTQ